MNRKVAVIMGSDSDYGTMKRIIPILQESDVDYDFRVISAHRTPKIAEEFARNAKINGYDLIIAGAGMSAHLAGVLAASTGVPIIGVPIKSDSSGMDGLDALHSVIQMPPGIPVATVGIDNAEGAARLAVKMMNCYMELNGDPVVKIVYNREEVSEASLEKAIKTLDVYGIKHITVDSVSALCREDNTFVILNLTDVNVEKIVQNDKGAKKIPIVEVPIKTESGRFMDTSHKIYQKVQASEATAFVGVNSYQNAAHIIARIVGIHDTEVYTAVIDEHAKLAAAVIEKDAKIRSEVAGGKLAH